MRNINRARSIYVGAGTFCVLLAVFCISARGDETNLGEAEQGGASQVAATSDPNDVKSLLDMDIAQLSQVQVKSPALEMPVSTVSRQDSTVGRSPAAVFVITNEMIRRSGVKNIPDALRMAPGIQVARIDGNKWAISSRGFQQRWSNMLLVQIDGRTVYDPLFAGVYWDAQDVVLEDVERIEVIRGPGASVWGSNAVNGVINIITKNSKETQGTLLQSGGGTEDLGFSTARYGGKLGDNGTYRVYGKWNEQSGGYNSSGLDVDDSTRQGRGGFRMDYNWTVDDQITFQGDFYNGYSGSPGFWSTANYPFVTYSNNVGRFDGQNALLRWKHVFDSDSDVSTQVYYDRTARFYGSLPLHYTVDTFDLDLQHRFPLAERHEFIWGFGYRVVQDAVENAYPGIYLDDPSRAYKRISYFAQDEITLKDDLWFLTLGSKFEHNDFTNFEFQPTVRLLCTPDKKHSIWGAVSRAVHVPTRSEQDLNTYSPPIAYSPIVVIPYLQGEGKELKSTDALAFEMGFREQTTDDFSWDLSAFANRYDKGDYVRSFTPYIRGDGAMIVPNTIVNNACGEVYGVELATDYRASERWRLHLSYTWLDPHMSSYDGTSASQGVSFANATSPHNQVYFQSSWDVRKNLEFDWITRYVDNIEGTTVPYYIVMDLRASWKATKNLELTIVGRNLLDWAHMEYNGDPYTGVVGTEVAASVYGQATLRY